MISQNQYHLTFNPRAIRHSKPEKQTRYVPQFRNNLNLVPPTRPTLNQTQPNNEQPESKRTDRTKQYHIPLNHNDSGYISNHSNVSISKREDEQRRTQQQRKKQEIMRRVRELQQRVLPMVGRQSEEEQGDTGWQSRVELKVMRLQTSLDSARKQWQIQMQRKLIELQSHWQRQFESLVSKYNHLEN